MKQWLHSAVVRFTDRSDPASVTRRGLFGRLAQAAGVGAIIYGAAQGDLVAKKRKNRGKQPKISDWYGTWSTRLSNGVQGTATFKKDILGKCCDGTYENTVGSGTFRCYTGSGNETDLGCRWDQDDGSSGDFVIDLTDEDHWKGSYRIDGGNRGTWSGVRR